MKTKEQIQDYRANVEKIFVGVLERLKTPGIPVAAIKSLSESMMTYKVILTTIDIILDDKL